MPNIPEINTKDRKRIRTIAERLLDPDWPGLCPAEVDEVVDLLQWPEAHARTVPENKEVIGRKSARSTLFSRRPSLALSFDDTLEMLPYCWEWHKLPVADGMEFVILDPDGRERARVTAKHSSRPHGMRLSDAQALAGAVLLAILNTQDTPDNG